MGIELSVNEFSLAQQSGLTKPIIYCNSCSQVEKEAVSISVALTKELKELRPSRRTMQLEKCFCKIISELPDHATIKDIDVMFNPVYAVDIMTLLITAYKKKPFSIIWPGTYSAGKLIYAEEGCPDYKVYNISEYDVTCIV